MIIRLCVGPCRIYICMYIHIYIHIYIYIYEQCLQFYHFYISVCLTKNGFLVRCRLCIFAALHATIWRCRTISIFQPGVHLVEIAISSPYLLEWIGLSCFVTFLSPIHHMISQCQTSKSGPTFIKPDNSGVGVTKPNSSVLLISRFFDFVKTLIIYWISCSYLTGVAAAKLRWHLSNMNAMQII